MTMLALRERGNRDCTGREKEDTEERVGSLLGLQLFCSDISLSSLFPLSLLSSLFSRLSSLLSHLSSHSLSPFSSVLSLFPMLSSLFPLLSSLFSLLSAHEDKFLICFNVDRWHFDYPLAGLWIFVSDHRILPHCHATPGPVCTNAFFLENFRMHFSRPVPQPAP